MLSPLLPDSFITPLSQRLVPHVSLVPKKLAHMAVDPRAM